MRIVFRSRKLHRICSQRKTMVREMGLKMAERLMQRLAELEAAESLDDMRLLPSARCHELTGDRKGQFAVDLVHPRRLIFMPEEDPAPRLAGGGLD